MAKRAKVKPAKIEPKFEAYRGGFGNFEVITDVNGKLWRVDLKNGHARPVVFGK